MTHDMTFCKTVTCPYRFTCERFADNHKFDSVKNISFCEFKHTITHCDYYIKKEKNK